MKILAKIHDKPGNLKEMDLFDTDRNPLEWPQAQAGGSRLFAAGKAVPVNTHPSYSGSEMNAVTSGLWSSPMRWVSIPEFGQADINGLAQLQAPGVYLVEVMMTYHLSLPVAGDYFFQGGARLIGPNQTIGLRGRLENTDSNALRPIEVSVPAGASHDTPGTAEMVVSIQQIVFIGANWYLNGGVDLTAPTGFDVSIYGNWADEMRSGFQAGDAANLMTHDGWSLCSFAKIGDGLTYASGDINT